MRVEVDQYSRLQRNAFELGRRVRMIYLTEIEGMRLKMPPVGTHLWGHITE